MVKVFLDDIRMPPDNSWVIVRNVSEAKRILQTNSVEWLSLDHDLGDNTETGYDLVKWLEEQVYEGSIVPMTMTTHSANPVGVKNMAAGIESINNIARRRMESNND
jgi:hypothetical protein